MRRSAGAQPEAITSSLITLRFPSAIAGPGGACTAALTTSAALAPVSGCYGREVKCMRGQR